MEPLLSQEELFELMRIVQSSRRIVICAHRGPDGDAVGSCLGWAEYLTHLGKQVKVVLPNPFPDFLRWLPNSHTIQFYAKHEKEARQIIQDADLIFCLDFNALDRLQEMRDAVAKSSADKVIIDHHLNPDREMARMTISHPEACSTSELVFRLIHQLGGFEQMTRLGATCIYTGMMTDTGAFTYNSNKPEIYQIISELIKKGIDKDEIYQRVFWVASESRLRLQGYVLYEKMKVYAGMQTALFTLSQEELKRFHYQQGDSEGFVNMPLSIKEVCFSVFLREDIDYIKVSLRSQGDFPCNQFAAAYFNGGGHKNASGGEFFGTLDEAVAHFERALAEFNPNNYEESLKHA